MDTPNIEDLGLEAAPEPTDADLSRVASLVRLQVKLEDEEAELDAALKRKREELQLVRERDLPNAMAECGVTEFAVEGGYKVAEKLTYRCGQLDDSPDKTDGKGRPLEERLEALNWLDLEGHGDLAKHVITVSLGRGQEALVDQIMEYLRSLRSNSLSVKRVRAVVWGTLAAFAREQDAAMNEPPLDLLGVSKVHVAKITRPKE